MLGNLRNGEGQSPTFDRRSIGRPGSFPACGPREEVITEYINRQFLDRQNSVSLRCTFRDDVHSRT